MRKKVTPAKVLNIAHPQSDTLKKPVIGRTAPVLLSRMTSLPVSKPIAPKPISSGINANNDAPSIFMVRSNLYLRTDLLPNVTGEPRRHLARSVALHRS